MVHRASSGALAVVAVLIDEGDANAALDSLFASFPQHGGETVQFPMGPFDATELLPSELSGFRYEGSLTTPPCSEGVHWTVFAEPLYASSEQIMEFTALYADDARPLQPLDDRQVH